MAHLHPSSAPSLRCLLAFVVALHLVLSAAGKDLTKESFRDVIGKDNHVLIKFFAPWCPHCIKLEPTWKSLMNTVNSDSSKKTIIARVDCTQESELCNQETVEGYPTLKLYRAQDKTGVDYEGPRDLDSLLEFLKKQLDVDIVVEKPVEEVKVKADSRPALSDEDEEEEDEEVIVPQGESDLVPDPVNGLHELTEDNYEAFLSNGRHFVKFYAPWCGHCQRLAPTWDKLASSFEHDKSVAISKVDCENYRSVCQKYNIKGYPTLLWIVDGKVGEKYSGARTHEDLKEFVSNKVEEEKKESDVVRPEDTVVYLTENNFSKVVKEGVTFVKFLAPWCAHCKRLAPVWEDLGAKVMGLKGAKVAKVDCAQFETLCNKHGVDGYPTLVLYKDGKRVSEFEEERTLENLYDFVEKHLDKPKDEL